MKRVLYVEDSTTSQLLMRKYLNSAYDLTITASPGEAEILLGHQKFDVIVTDFLFSGGDAFDLICSIRRRHTAEELPVIVVSSSMDTALLTRVIKAGANDGMPKPLSTLEFRAMMVRMLEQPYVRTSNGAITSVCCFQWAEQGKFFEYCPELNLTFSGNDRAEVAGQMAASLQEQLAKGAACGFTNHERTVTHLIKT